MLPPHLPLRALLSQRRSHVEDQALAPRAELSRRVRAEAPAGANVGMRDAGRTHGRAATFPSFAHRRPLRLLGVLAAACTLWLIAAAPSRAAAPPSAAQLTTLFASMSKIGWAGGDGAYSTLMPDGRTVWAFGDTMVPNTAGGLDMMHSSMIVTGKGWPKIFINPIVQPKARFFYWPSTVHPAGGQAVWMLAVKTLIDASGIHIVGIGLGRYDINTGRQLSFRDIPGLNGKIGYGNEIFDYGGYTYLYGWLGAKTTTYMYVARVPAGRLDARWSYYTGTSWSPSPAAARPVLSGGGGPGLLNLGNLGLVAVSQDIMLGRTIWAWRAQTPYGPFTAKHAVGTIPNEGPGTFSYLAHPHPQYSTSTQTMFSFSTNTLSKMDPWAFVALYRPRFFTISNATLAGRPVKKTKKIR